jgi:hypothetical protein
VRGAQPLALEDTPFLDTGAFDNPFVAGVDHLRQFGIAQNVRRHIAVHAGDRGFRFPHPFFRLAHA